MNAAGTRGAPGGRVRRGRGFVLRRVLAGGAIALVVIAAVALHRVVGIATAFFAKQLCSAVFVSGRVPDDVARDDLRTHAPVLVMRGIAWQVDPVARTVRAEWQGVLSRAAAWRDGTGCAPVSGAAGTTGGPAGGRSSPDAEALRPRDIGSDGFQRDGFQPDELWPLGERTALADTVRGRPRDALDAAVALAFAPGTATRAVVVVVDGRLVAERYAEGFGPATPLPGWSMAKSVTQALVGTLVRDGRIALDEPLALAAWSAAGDPRAAITFRHALAMATGLDLDERYWNPLADVAHMLFEASDAAAVAARHPLGAAPGSVWAYTSGTTNLISRALRERLGEAAYRALPEAALFRRIGMRTAVFETDASGTFVGSSFLHASARDWARFGLLFADDGVWDGVRVLPADWVRLSREPVAGSAGRYGLHFWLGAGDARVGAGLPDAGPRPDDAFHAAGHAGQFATIVPSARLVVVRLGHSVGANRWDQTRLVRDVLRAVEDGEASRIKK